MTDVAAGGPQGAVAIDADDRFYATTSGGVGALPSRLSIKPSKRRLRKPATIRVTGKLAPARGGERVLLAARTAGGGWDFKSATVASNGAFTTRWRVRRSTIFVGQWIGDDRVAGDGTRVVSVKVAKRR